MDRDYDWGRPDGRPFSPELLTLEEWLLLYRYLPVPGATERPYIRVAVPTKMEARAYDRDATAESVAHMPIVEFHMKRYYGCSHVGKQGYAWYPHRASQEVLGLLRTAGLMNPLGDKY